LRFKSNLPSEDFCCDRPTIGAIVYGQEKISLLFINAGSASPTADDIGTLLGWSAI
jgi:hypothetical protein